MERLDIFKSEGGYRLAKAVHNDCPVMDYSPWYKTMELAEKAKVEVVAKEAIDTKTDELLSNLDKDAVEQLWDKVRKHGFVRTAEEEGLLK